MTAIEQSKDSFSKILWVYVLFGMSIVLSLFPYAIAATGSFIALLAVMMGAYILRAGKPPESLTYNHMTFISRTIWIGSLLASMTLSLGAFYLMKIIDNSPLNPCIDKFLNVGPDTFFDLSSMPAIFESCMARYISVNIQPFIISGAIAAVPAYLYFLMRFARGFSRALDSTMLEKPLEWF